MPERQTGRLDTLLAPRRVLGALAALFVVTLLIAPWPEAGDRGPALSSYVAAPSGARGLHNVLDRLGFAVERRLEPMREVLDSSVTFVVLEPVVPLTAGEVNHVLDAVRSGAGLVMVPGARSRIADSLGVRSSATLVDDPGTTIVDDTTGVPGPGWVRRVLRRTGPGADSAAVYEPANATTFLSLETRRGVEPMIIGLPLGRGRVIAAADPALFTNQVVRQGGPAVRAVRLFEWITDGRTRTVVFDEYHQGFGTHASITRVTRRALLSTGPGRVALQLGVAGLVLLLAVAIRPLRPRPRLRTERRSPLEHVSALARAYAAVHATDRAARLLVRGMRRRLGGPRGDRDDAAYLSTIGERHPEVAADVQRVLDRMAATTGSAGGDDISAAIIRIERAIGS